VIGRATRRLRATLERVGERFARRPVILLYHRIAADGPDPFGLCVSPAHFAEQLQVLAAEYEPVSLGELAARVRAGEATRREVALTFDDGYRDNLLAALPLLQRHGIPATFFVVSGQLGSERGFWWDRLAAAFLHDRPLPSRILVPIGDQVEVVDSSLSHRMQTLHRLHERLMVLPSDIRDAALSAIFGACAPGCDPKTPAEVLTASEVRSISGHPHMEIGAHSMTHPVLTRLAGEERRAEIRKGRDDLQAVVGRTIHAFAYPYGYFDDDTVRDVRGEGIEYACTCVPRRIGRGQDPLRLPRLEARNCGAVEFRRALGWSLPRPHFAPSS
jgi:peptidoglycan/xylan/chitin deacetylase (PgdA/CDA1 family)